MQKNGEMVLGVPISISIMDPTIGGKRMLQLFQNTNLILQLFQINADLLKIIKMYKSKNGLLKYKQHKNNGFSR